jgi:hypothetical protein
LDLSGVEKMIFISHRINTIKELIETPTHCGVEIDLRDDLDQTWYFQDINVNVHEALLAEISYLKYQNLQKFICQLKDLFNLRKV